MKIDLYLVGIGTGNIEHVTKQAMNILVSSDIIMVPKKGSEKSDLANLRYQICDQLLGSKHHLYLNLIYQNVYLRESIWKLWTTGMKLLQMPGNRQLSRRG